MKASPSEKAPVERGLSNDTNTNQHGKYTATDDLTQYLIELLATATVMRMNTRLALVQYDALIIEIEQALFDSVKPGRIS